MVETYALDVPQERTSGIISRITASLTKTGEEGKPKNKNHHEPSPPSHAKTTCRFSRTGACYSTKLSAIKTLKHKATVLFVINNVRRFLACPVNEDQNKPISPRFPKRYIIAFVVIALLAAGFIPPRWYYSYSRETRAFIHHWSERFHSVESLDMAKQLAQSQSVYVRTLSSGEWFIATCEHSCCSGAGFDATVIRDSTGAIYADTTHTFCGIEGMSGELGDVSADSLSAFYLHANQLKLQKQ